MTDTFIKASLHKSKTAFIAVSLMVSTSLFASDVEKDMETMQKAIIELIGHYNDTNNALEVMNKKNKILETKVAELQAKLKEVQEEQSKMRKPRATVEVFGVFAQEPNKDNGVKTGKVTAQTLHKRKEPTANAKHIGYLKNGEIVEIEEIVTNNNGRSWAKLKSGGYASIKWIEIQTNTKE